MSCHGATAIGDDRTTCSNRCLDEAGRAYESVCAGTTCECWFEGERLCSCERGEPIDGPCDAPGMCCPPPWL